jgi:hypothetical protein
MDNMIPSYPQDSKASIYDGMIMNMKCSILIIILILNFIILKHILFLALTTRKTLIEVSMLVTDCFGAALLLRAAAWKNTPRYHYRPVGGVTARPTAPLVSWPDHAPNLG